MPKVSIGLPAYNNQATLKSAVESLLAQSFGDFELLISDDCSTDATEDVGRSLAALDGRVKYFRQSQNLRYQNFGYVLRQARADYFMWAAGDDRWKPEFLAACIEELSRRADFVSVVSRVQFEEGGRPIRLATGTYTLDGTLEENLVRFLSAPDDNSRMYGVFRTLAAQQSFPAVSFHAYDWAFSAASLRFGRQLELPEVLMCRDLTPSARYVEMVRTDSDRALSRLFPVLDMTRWLLALPGIPVRPKVLAALLALNADKHIQYAERFHPRYAELAGPMFRLWKAQRWRLVAIRR